MARLRSNRCSRILAIVWALVGSALPSAAVALEFDADQRIYLESFQGESSYPTTPEVDETGAGGLTGRAIGPGGGVPGEPELTGSAARVAVFDIGPASGEEVSGLGTLDSSSVGLRGAFDAFTMVGDGSASAGVVAVFDDTFTTPTFVAATVLVTRSSGTTSATLRLGQIPLAPIVTTPLSTAFADALLAGAAFTVDLYVDRDADVMLASVHAAPHEGSISDTLIPMPGAVSASWSQGGGYSSLDPNPPTSVQIDMTSFEVYSDLMRSFNVDVGIAAAGTPSAAYGAAGATGVWNSILGGASALVDTQGHMTGATATLAPATESGWIGGPSDDFSLMGDHVQMCGLSRAWTLDFAGLPNGHYELFVYGPASSQVQTGDIDVTTASSTFTIANVAGNTSVTLVEGESWRSAPVHVTDGTLGLFGEFGLACGGIAGVQLVALDSGIPPVPALGAPARALALVALLVLVALRGARSATAPT